MTQKPATAIRMTLITTPANSSQNGALRAGKGRTLPRAPIRQPRLKHALPVTGPTGPKVYLKDSQGGQDPQ